MLAISVVMCCVGFAGRDWVANSKVEHQCVKVDIQTARGK